MLRKILSTLIGLTIAIWVGALFAWAFAALLASFAFSVFRQWELASLCTLACVCWGYGAFFFARLPFVKSDADETNRDGAMNDPATARRIAGVFGIVSGTGFGLVIGLVLAVSRLWIVSPEFLPLGLMFSTTLICWLMCYAMPDLGPEILSALENTVG
ncbi:hypothetical protein LOC67_26915 [Stieleria sp. JC731]|uniref:hypothetical protein n=1 Tax=Stieleria sp. JC731 TaxID=2894195 RepID=UPI001E58F500|nr:hypothetical protein [Stieleria sp. JC731]MCC9604202.1 hypothetical protein [Stieleria sp. JC731]